MTGIRELFTVPFADSHIPESHWEHGDDLCDCEFQRIGLWMNPYLGVTEKVRVCCLYKELEDSFPHLFQHIDGYWDDNEKEWITGQMEWDGEDDMPRALWNRQLSIREGLPIEVIRERTIFQSPPKGTPRPKRMTQPMPLSDIYAEYGKLRLEQDKLIEAFQKALDAIALVKDGVIDPADIEVFESGFTIRSKEKVDG